MPNTDSEEPSRINVLRDSAAPMCKKSRTDSVDPKREIPHTDIVDPSRRNVLRDSEDPMFT